MRARGEDLRSCAFTQEYKGLRALVSLGRSQTLLRRAEEFGFLHGELEAFLQSLQTVLHDAQHASKPAGTRAPSSAGLDARQANPPAFRQGIRVSAGEFEVFLQFKQITFYEVAKASKQASNNKQQASPFLCRFGASVGFGHWRN